MNNDRLDAHLAELAQDYNRPPSTPREAMWTAIRTARSDRHGSRRRPWLASLVGMAATFLLGILIGGGLPGTSPSAEPASNANAAALIDAETSLHFARVDLLLRSIRGDLQVGAVPSGVPLAARALLADTRFLTDLPPEEHLPEVAALLADIELVLAQIALLDGAADPDELRLIEEGIEDRDVMSRLHHFALNL